MSVIDGIIEAFASPMRSEWTTSDSHWLGISNHVHTTSGETVSAESAFLSSAYWACIRNISEDIAKVNIDVFRRTDDENKQRDPAHPVHRLLHDEPNPEMSAQTFVQTVTHWCLGWGNGYAEIVVDPGGRPVELWPIHPQYVCPVRLDDNSLAWEVRKPGSNDPRIIRDEFMLHVQNMGNGVVGYSVFRAAADSIGLTQAIEKFGSAFFANGIAPSGILMHPEQLGEEELERLRESWAARYGSAENSMKPLILEEGMKWEQMSIPPEEAQFLESRKFQTVEICRWFRMPPHKIQHLDDGVRANVEEQSISYAGDTLMPWVRRWETEIGRKLLAPHWTNTHLAEFNLNALMRADSKARAEFYGKMQERGNLTINEVRSRENMNGIGAQGDQHFVPLNMTTADRMLSGEADGTGTSAGAARAAQARIEASARKQRKAIDRAVNRYAEKPVHEFHAWAAKFYADHDNELRGDLASIAEGVAVLCGSKDRIAEVHREVCSFTSRQCSMWLRAASHALSDRSKIDSMLGDQAIRDTCDAFGERVEIALTRE